MIKNYLTIALRNLRRHPGYGFINIMGLSVGLACCLLILLFVREELSFDRFHDQADRIYRVVRVPGEATSDVADAPSATLPPAVGPALIDYFPEVQEAIRLHKADNLLVRSDAEAVFQAYEDGFLFADSAYFDVFSFPLLSGDPATALDAPYSVILTETMAHKYFGSQDPLGQTLTIDNEYQFAVTGVVADPPANSSIPFNFLASFSSLPTFKNGAFIFRIPWRANLYPTYVLLHPEGDPHQLENAFHTFVQAHTDDESLLQYDLVLESITEEHLSRLAPGSLIPGAEARYIYIFSTIALLILLLASVNYMNLATARSIHRAREVGMRKVAGASRGQLVRQFLSEAVLLCLIAFPLALMLVEGLAPLFGTLVQRDIGIDYSNDLVFLLAVMGLVGLVGLFSGSYPAWHLARVRPATMLKGHPTIHGHAATLRKGLVVFQFTISALLIISALSIQHQLDYMRSKPLGFTPEQVIVMPLRGPLAHSLGSGRQPVQALKEALLAQEPVVAATAASMLPGKGIVPLPVTTDRTDLFSLPLYWADDDFLGTMEIEVLAGRGFEEGLADDSHAILLNETAVQEIGWQDPIGKTVTLHQTDYEVVGVVKDFHFTSLQEAIQPLGLLVQEENHRFLAARIQTDNLPSTLASLETTWKQFLPDYPFDFFFLDAAFDQLYQAEDRLAQIFNAFTFIALLIACLGIFGLAAFTTEQRTKEIGIRKILGASVPSIILLISKQFLKLVGLAFLLAAPLAYVVMNRWLDDFAYRIELGSGIFLLAGVMALVIALGTVSYQAIKAALADPVQSLRYE